ncbi:MAG: hypothetical protein H0T11_05455 [Chthoniobacterales bacterium]|nr:hypothetical protein [Chthoniobacterales bacterium]
MKSGFLEKLIERLGRVGPDEVENYLLRLAQEKGLSRRSSTLLIKSGTMSFYSSEDPTCMARTYSAGQAFVGSGQGHMHTARNEQGVGQQQQQGGRAERQPVH